MVNSVNRQKLLPIAGSNASFGISCKMIYEATEFPCINGGTSVDLGIHHILDNARSWAKPGDIVILPLEYLHYQYSGGPNQQLIEYVFAYDMNYFKKVDTITKLSMIGGISFETLIKNFRYSIQQKKHHNKQNQPSTTLTNQTAYGYINKYGDRTDYTEKLNHIDQIKPMKTYGYIENTGGMKIIRKFAEWCKLNDIQVFAAWPNTIWFDVYQDPDKQKYFQSLKDFYKKIKVPILGKPEDFMFDKSMFYDTIYHLNTKGRYQSTQKLIDLLKPHLKEIKIDK
ncbi:MAG: hypothetical protein AAF757_26010 [Cyanobacteria bacterium P01_D01_bin.116]